jgi:peptide/nickel transport system substrate-binding protein
MSARRILAAIGAVLICVAAATGCAGSSGAGDSGSPGSGGTLTLGGLFGAVNFDPWESPNGANASLQIMGAVYDSLTLLKGTNTVVPGLATNWTFTTPTTMDITLRSVVKFSDGTPVDAAAVKANFDYAKKVSDAGQLNAVLAGVTTTVVSPTQLKLTLSAPNPDLPFDFATSVGYIANPKALADPKNLETTPDGSGPYSLSASGTISQQQYTFVRRAGYWNAASYPYEKVVFKIFNSTQALDDALRSGQVNGTSGSASLLAADKAAGASVETGPSDGIAGLWLNDRAGKLVPALGNVLVRQALNYAIDRTAIMKAADNGYGQPGSLVVTPGQPGYGAALNQTYSYDPAKAKQLLTQAGYPNGFTLPVLSTEAGDVVVQAIAGYLQVIGVKLEISDHNTDFVQQALSGKWPAMVFSWGIVPVAQSLASLLSPAGIGNPLHSSDPQITADLEQALSTTGPTQTAALQKLVARVNQQAWFVLIGYGSSLYVTNKTTCTIAGGILCMLNSFRPE